MRILLVSANTEAFPEPVFPIGTVYVGGALQRAGANVRIFDLRYAGSGAALRKELETCVPDAIGISLRNIDNAAYPARRSYLPAYRSLVKSLKEWRDIPIILGGPAFSLFPEEILMGLGADAGIRGEGEGAIDVFRMPGQGRIMTGTCASLDHVAFPKDIEDMFPDFHRYRTIGVQTARGCPNRCIYCTYPLLEGRSVRARPAEAVADDMARLSKDHGVRDFFLVDSLFNADERHMGEVLEALVKADLRVRFSCYLKPAFTDLNLFVLLKRAGCVGVDFGTDSGSDAMLNALAKPFTRDDIRRSSRACRAAGLDYCHSLLLGGPGESVRTIRETVHLMDEVSPRAVVAMAGIRIYPGTVLERIAGKEGALQEDASLLEPRFYVSGMGAYALLECAYEAGARRRNWFFPGKRDWGSALGFRVLRFLHRKGPLWKVLGT